MTFGFSSFISPYCVYMLVLYYYCILLGSVILVSFLVFFFGRYIIYVLYIINLIAFVYLYYYVMYLYVNVLLIAFLIGMFDYLYISNKAKQF